MDITLLSLIVHLPWDEMIYELEYVKTQETVYRHDSDNICIDRYDGLVAEMWSNQMTRLFVENMIGKIHCKLE